MSAALAEPPPTPPPTTDVFEDQLPPKLSRTPPAKKHPGSATQCLLPYIDPSLSGSMMSVVKSEAHPTSMHSDFLPADLLFTLKRQENRSLQATPSGSSKTTSPGGAKLSFQTISSGLRGVKPPKPPAKLWYYSNRRDRLKHLTDAHPCICGAGRDISFLYDNQSAEKDNSTKKVNTGCFFPALFYISLCVLKAFWLAISLHFRLKSSSLLLILSPLCELNSLCLLYCHSSLYLLIQSFLRSTALLNTLEYWGWNYMKSKLRYYQFSYNCYVLYNNIICSEYVAQTENHDCHMTIFPSTKPSGRHEVLQLKVSPEDFLPFCSAIILKTVFLQHTFDLMLQRAGVPTEINDSDLQGPTEVNLAVESF